MPFPSTSASEWLFRLLSPPLGTSIPLSDSAGSTPPHAASPPGSGAIAVIELFRERPSGDPLAPPTLDSLWPLLAVSPVARGSWGVRRVADLDDAVVVVPPGNPDLAASPPSPSDRRIVRHDRVYLLPHAGPAVLHRLCAWLLSRGFLQPSQPHPRASPQALHAHRSPLAFPESSSHIEDRVLEILPSCASPLGVDLLLDQPRRWSAHESDSSSHSRSPGVPPSPTRPDNSPVAIRRRSDELRWLLAPPTVVALGSPNIGKSSLLNALAGRTAAIVADAPGTTRDYVAAELSLAGILITYLDTPGLTLPPPFFPVPLPNPTSPARPAHCAVSPDDAIQHAAQRIALDAARRARVILLCADPFSDYPDPASLGLLTDPDTRILRVALRQDLADPSTPSPPLADARVSVRSSRGIWTPYPGHHAALVDLIRDAAVAPWARNDGGLWQFWSEPAPQ